MSSQADLIPNIQLVKRQIQYDNYRFNQQQLNQKHQKLRRFKSQQQQLQQIMNYRALNELQNQKYKEIKKKYTVQNILQNQYDQQIYDKKRIKTEQKSYDKTYSENQKLMLQHYQRNRIKQLGRIYNIGNQKKNKQTSRLAEYRHLNRSVYNPESNETTPQNYKNHQYSANKIIMNQNMQIPETLQQYKQKSLVQNLQSQYNKQQLEHRLLSQNQLSKQTISLNLKPLKNHQNSFAPPSRQRQRKIQTQQSQQGLRQFNNSQFRKPSPKLSLQDLKQPTDHKQQVLQKQQSSIHQQQSLPSLQNSRTSKYSPLNLDYSLYLKKQIQRKNKQRQLKKQQQRQKDREFIQRQNKAYYDSLEQMKYKKEKRKWDYALGLEKQIQYKQQRNGNGLY